MITDYERAKRIGMKEVRKCFSEGRYPYLMSLEDIVPDQDLTNVRRLGLMDVPIDKIAGTRTKGRQNAFADNFMPILEPDSEFAVKWSTLYDSQRQEGIRDAIEAYEYMGRFYVEEGNKRVSVSRFAGVRTILADVTRILPKRTDDPVVRHYYEFVDFYEVCPLYGIEFTSDHGYEKLAEACGQDLEHRWTESMVRRLQSSYYRFEAVFREKGGADLAMTAADAMLVYLSIYPFSSLDDASDSELKARIDKLWGEITIGSEGQQIDMVESPDEAPKESRSIIGILTRGGGYSAKRPLKAAFIFDHDTHKSSWSYAHELGRSSLAERFCGAVDAIPFDGCNTDEKVRKAVDDAAAAGCQLIFTTSLTQMAETQKCALHYQDVQFMNCSINLMSSEVATYYARMYEAKFIMGGLAAMASDNHKIGYRANFPIYGTVADINAFAIGAAMIDPSARIYLSWAETGNSDWEDMLREEQIDVISGLEMIRPDAASRAYGLYMTDGDKIYNLCAPVWDWGKYYEQILRPIVEGRMDPKQITAKDKALNYYWGMSAGVVDVIHSERIPFYSRKTMDRVRDALVYGHMTPFDGELHSQQGMIKGPKAPRLSAREIVTMDWLNDNVIGRIPTLSELTPKAKDLVAVSGLIESEKEEAAGGRIQPKTGSED